MIFIRVMVILQPKLSMVTRKEQDHRLDVQVMSTNEVGVVASKNVIDTPTVYGYYNFANGMVSDFGSRKACQSADESLFVPPPGDEETEQNAVIAARCGG